MQTGQKTPRDTDQYIAGFPREVQAILQKVRQSIKSAAPKAKETMGYGIPTFMLDGKYLIYFAGYKTHIGIYPVPRGTAAFNKMLSAYRTGKGTLQFALDRPMPYALVSKIVKARIKENAAKAAAKGQKRK